MVLSLRQTVFYQCDRFDKEILNNIILEKYVNVRKGLDKRQGTILRWLVMV